MRIVRTILQPPAATRGAAVAIGNFDGVHLGHREVIAAAREAAGRMDAPTAVLTFEPHPRGVLRPGAPFRITPFRLKARYLAEAGVDVLFVAHFTPAFSRLDADEFATRVLVNGLSAAHVAVGHDFVFGRGRSGNTAVLDRFARTHGFGLSVVAPVASPEREAYASRRIRALLEAGDPAAAAQQLGRWWEITGIVRHGAARGRTLGYPTANVPLGPILRARFGVYAVRVRVGDEPHWRPAVASLGIRPMFDAGAPLLEAHLFDYTGDLYGRRVCVQMVAFLRPEMKFPGLAELTQAMDADSTAARGILAVTPATL